MLRFMARHTPGPRCAERRANAPPSGAVVSAPLLRTSGLKDRSDAHGYGRPPSQGWRPGWAVPTLPVSGERPARADPRSRAEARLALIGASLSRNGVLTFRAGHYILRPRVSGLVVAARGVRGLVPETLDPFASASLLLLRPRFHNRHRGRSF